VVGHRCPKTLAWWSHLQNRIVWGCSQCYSNPKVPQDKKLYTGRKIWREDQYATREQIKEANYNFEQRVKAQVAENFRTMRKSTRKALYGG